MCAKVFFLGCIFALPVVHPFIRLRIIHFNDIHSRITQIPQNPTESRKCTQSEEESNLCFGGLPRMITAADQERKRAEKDRVPLIFLTAGDYLVGSLWYSYFKWEIVSTLMKPLQIDAMGIGYGDFDQGPRQLSLFIKSLNIPAVGCNMNSSGEPDLRLALKPSTIIKRGHLNIGIIGYTSAQASVPSDTGKVIFNDEIESIKIEVQNLKKKGVNLIIGLGHSGFKKDQEIARAIPEMDIIVGSASHTFLYTGKPPDIEIPMAPYPFFVTEAKDRIVPIVHTLGYTKYLGFLEVSLNDDMSVVDAVGNPILLNTSIKQNEEALEEIIARQPDIDFLKNTSIAQSSIPLNSSCRFSECNLGNLVTDAYVDYGMLNLERENWSAVAIAITHAGALREIVGNAKGNITGEHILTALPYNNHVSVFLIKGIHLLQALEWSMTGYDIKNETSGRKFLQVSGLHIIYDLNKPDGFRVVRVAARCANCEVPAYFPLELEKSYPIALNEYISQGNGGYDVFKKHKTLLSHYGDRETYIVIEYMTKIKYFYTGYEERIVINTSPSTITIKPMLLILCAINYILQFVTYCLHNNLINLNLPSIYNVFKNITITE